jgi:hypothetical protein
VTSVWYRRAKAIRTGGGRVLITSAIAAFLASCTKAASGPPLPPPPAVVAVRMTEYRFEYPTVVPSGRVVFRVTNAGKELHNLVMVPLPEDDPPIKAILADDVRQVLTPFGGIRDQLPGAGATFAVDLVKDRRYAMLCILADAQERSHSVLGMASEFRPAARG